MCTTGKPPRPSSEPSHDPQVSPVSHNPPDRNGYRQDMRLITRFLAAVAVAGTLLTPSISTPSIEAASPTCYIGFLYGSSYANGGQARCVNAVRWRVVVNCGINRTTTTAVTTVYGPWRYPNYVYGEWSRKFCPSTYPYARWVSREYIA